MAIDTYKTATFEQGALLNNTYPIGSPLRQGVCFSLVLQWTKNHMKQPTGTASSRMAALRGKIKSAGARQRMYDEMLGQGSSTGAVENAPMKFLGMKSVVKFDYAKFAAFANEVGSDPDYQGKYTEVGFFFVDAKGNSDGGHSMGMYFGKTNLTYFDPNFGEFDFKSGKAESFLKDLSGTYPKINLVQIQVLEEVESLIQKFGG